MIIFISSADRDKGLNKVDEVVKKMLIRRPGASVFRVSNENWEQDFFDHLIESQDLFVRKSIIILDNLFSNNISEEFLINNLERIKKSENAFIVYETKPNKKLFVELKRFTEKIFEIKSAKTNQVERFNVFSLSDVLGKRDKKTAWLIYIKALKSDLSPEEIYGTIWWQFKTIFLSLYYESAEDVDMKPYVFNKAKSFSKNFSEEELRKILSDLVALYHCARKGDLTLELALERFILSI